MYAAVMSKWQSTCLAGRRLCRAGVSGGWLGHCEAWRYRISRWPGLRSCRQSLHPNHNALPHTYPCPFGQKPLAYSTSDTCPPPVTSATLPSSYPIAVPPLPWESPW